MTPRLSFSSKQQMLAKPHLMLISPCPWLPASVRTTEPVYPTPISREDQGSMSVIACQDLLGKSVKLTLTSASLFHAFEVRRPMSTFSKVLRGMWIFIYSSILYMTSLRDINEEGGIGIFGFGYFLDRFFGFCYLTYLGSGFSSIQAVITRLHLSLIAAKRKCYREECETNQLKYRRDP